MKDCFACPLGWLSKAMTGEVVGNMDANAATLLFWLKAETAASRSIASPKAEQSLSTVACHSKLQYNID
jgi:hypothetical protein